MLATYPVSLAASLHLAFDQLATEEPAALTLLLLAAQLAPEPIPLARRALACCKDGGGSGYAVAEPRA